MHESHSSRLVGYARVSTVGQTLETQIEHVIFLDRRAAAPCARPRTTHARRSPPSAPGSCSTSGTATRRSTTRCCCRRARAASSPTRRVLWNAAEAAERRKDAQVAREIVLALPANAELTIEDRIELARSFAH